MADLQKSKAGKLAAMQSLKNRPLPPARQNLSGSEIKGTSDSLKIVHAQVSEPTPQAQTEPIAPEQTAKVEPAKPNRAKVTKKTKPDQKLRFMLSFIDEALHDEAVKVAGLYSVPILDLMRAIAKEVSIEEIDFREAVEVEETFGETLRYPLSFYSDMANGYITTHDPLGLHANSVSLRPVAQHAFDRAARAKLVALKKGR